MNKYIDAIKNTTLMKSLSHEDIENHLNSGKFKVVSYNKNSVVHFESEHCLELEVILSGRVAVDRIDESGNLLTISEFYSDDILGGNLLFSKNPYYPMTVTTKLPSEILQINKDLLFELFFKNSDFLRTYLEFISDHAFILGDKIKHYVNKTIRESIMSFLNYECKIQNSKKINLSITKKSLAEKIGIQRTSLSRELAKMKKDKLIDFDSESITIY